MKNNVISFVFIEQKFPLQYKNCIFQIYKRCMYKSTTNVLLCAYMGTHVYMRTHIYVR